MNEEERKALDRYEEWAERKRQRAIGAEPWQFVALGLFIALCWAMGWGL